MHNLVLKRVMRLTHYSNCPYAFIALERATYIIIIYLL